VQLRVNIDARPPILHRAASMGLSQRSTSRVRGRQEDGLDGLFGVMAGSLGRGRLTVTLPKGPSDGRRSPSKFQGVLPEPLNFGFETFCSPWADGAPAPLLRLAAAGPRRFLNDAELARAAVDAGWGDARSSCLGFPRGSLSALESKQWQQADPKWRPGPTMVQLGEPHFGHSARLGESGSRR